MVSSSTDSTSLEPRPIPTLDEDLLIRIDLPPGVEIAGTIRVRMRILPNSTENEEDEEIPVDGEFSGVSSFYPFIPKLVYIWVCASHKYLSHLFLYGAYARVIIIMIILKTLP